MKRIWKSLQKMLILIHSSVHFLYVIVMNVVLEITILIMDTCRLHQANRIIDVEVGRVLDTTYSLLILNHMCIIIFPAW